MLGFERWQSTNKGLPLGSVIDHLGGIDGVEARHLYVYKTDINVYNVKHLSVHYLLELNNIYLQGHGYLIIYYVIFICVAILTFHLMIIKTFATLWTKLLLMLVISVIIIFSSVFQMLVLHFTWYGHP